MTIDKLIIGASKIIEGAVKDFGYTVSSGPMKIDGSRPISYFLSIRPEVDMIEHYSNNNLDKAKEAVEEAIPGLEYKGHQIKLSYGEKMWAGPPTIPVPDREQ